MVKNENQIGVLLLRWDLRSSDSTSVMTFKRFEEFVSSFCKVVVMSCFETSVVTENEMFIFLYIARHSL